ncbi:two component transcriptional regulator, LuxR family [Fibrella aestuarina BUZ 2]|uniref:Two component transcriptional regulator, LuxR family n=1 Tax=Fibrella aestuarina BUZ 2 TaxID=1166018 RepID=I0KDM4_9BACT|nr:response regulator transcription factor [Fibrella aestuarina]CCH02227.1 two component transcriptional regulator, LuxR family [Fibrella aestuarina BUZ 2]
MKKGIPQTVAYWLPDQSALVNCFTNPPDFYTFINAADYGDDILQTLCQLLPNFVLVEPDPGCHESSIELVKRIRTWPKLPVKCVVLLPSGVSWLNAFDELDISGKVCADHVNDELVSCLSKVAAGYRFLSPHFGDRNRTTTSHPVLSEGKLTSREYEVVEQIARGYTNKEIAERLFISVKTVETHKFNVLQKLNLRSMGELRQWMRQKDPVGRG